MPSQHYDESALLPIPRCSDTFAFKPGSAILAFTVYKLMSD
jgi:hypothetical protein